VLAPAADILHLSEFLGCLLLLLLLQKPDSWRLACQTIVGDGENSGTVVIQAKPQGR
jgi:hypothetical protein